MSDLIIDAHVHHGKVRESRINGDAKFLVKMADSLGMEKLCVSSIKSLRYDFYEGNKDLFEAMKQYPSRILGYVTVNPRFGTKAVEEVRKGVKEYGMIGVKLHAQMHMYPGDDPVVYPIVEEAIRLGVPVKIHAPADETDRLAELFPDAVIIMCHMGGGGDWLKGLRTAKRRDNIILDTTSSCTEVGMIEDVVKSVGPERIVFGSDMPLLNPITQLAKIKTANISEEAKRLILGGNMRRILKLEEI